MLFIASTKPNEPRFPADQAPFPILVTSSSEHLLTFANQAALSLWGDDLDIGRPVPAELLPSIEACFHSHEETKSDEVYMEHLNDAKRTGRYQVTCHPVAARRGQADGVMTFVMDVTGYAQKRFEAEEANKAKSAFLSQMSHEIRSPLSSIIEHCEVFRDARGQYSQADHFVTMVERNSHYILSLINEIRDLDKVETGKMSSQSVAFSLHALLAEVEADMMVRALRKGLDFHLDVAPAVPETVISDPKLIRQILHNILSNTLKHTNRGSIQLSVEPKDNGLEFTLKDLQENFGAECDDPSAIPETKYTAAQKFAGYGIGSVITRKIIATLGGSMELHKNGPDQVSSLIVHIPVARANQPRRKDKVVCTEANDRLKGTRVLVVDDAMDNQFIFNNFLAQAGAESECANNGKEAVDMVSHDSFDAVLMDIRMPVMDGVEAMHILRSRGFKKPIIALTAHAMTGQKIRAMEAGFTDYVTKPVSRERLVDLIYKCLH